jgi:hypothetical protein
MEVRFRVASLSVARVVAVDLLRLSLKTLLFCDLQHGAVPLPYDSGIEPPGQRRTQGDERGTNENTNGLLRQYLPKGIDVSSYSQAKLNAMARQLNERPRKTLGYRTPAEMFSLSVASTG